MGSPSLAAFNLQNDGLWPRLPPPHQHPWWPSPKGKHQGGRPWDPPRGFRQFNPQAPSPPELRGGEGLATLAHKADSLLFNCPKMNLICFFFLPSLLRGQDTSEDCHRHQERHPQCSHLRRRSRHIQFGGAPFVYYPRTNTTVVPCLNARLGTRWKEGGKEGNDVPK